MTSNHVVEMGLGADWVVEMEWPEGEIQGGPVRLVVRPADPDSYPTGGLSSTVVRGIDFREGATRLRSQIADADDLWARIRRNSEESDPDRMQRLRGALTEGITDPYLALLSSAYVSLVNRGQTKPVEYLAEGVGKSVGTVKGHLWQARKRGLLTGSPGRKGGLLTVEAMTILRRLSPEPERREK
ncbi:hypothetical protein [Rhodococcus wratislaviensis]|uniref:hypothetical protein n=1 Tax=Rhodococcus wratislaviensis TaxID=44752 RepID=UPI000F55C9F0|nr:hypothetical protein [Rhodococcus wratislaviensis]